MMLTQLSARLPKVHSGKVRETFKIPEHPDKLLLMVTDRVSMHNIVHQSTIPQKGEVLTALTIFWLTGPLKDSPHHLVAAGDAIWQYLPVGIKQECPGLQHRALIVLRLDMDPVEYIFRSRLTGSLKNKYYDLGKDPYGLELPPGLVEMSRFADGNIFTPTRKSKNDTPLKSRRTMWRFPKASLLTSQAYAVARDRLAWVGIELIDSKEESGTRDGVSHLADEVFTPDSSRFAEASLVREGESPPWLDKQLLRDEAERIWPEGKKYSLAFNECTLRNTAKIYNGLVERITGHPLSRWKRQGYFDYVRG